MDRAFRLIVFIVIAGWGVLLYCFDPETHDSFLSCPFEALTGLLCPGCGAQRSVHDLLHLRIGEALGHNAALVLALPALTAQWTWKRFTNLDPARDNRVVWAWAIALVAWGVARNLPGLEALAP
ncbi:MAG: DUF2752 domain-containing protein [Flavobacteriales bacterium]|nr:DUF2752 domain-containing protein [Flavobacteriales bacterium]